jgi:hypothetical protein
MDIWRDGHTDEWTLGQMNVWINGYMEKLAYGEMDRWIMKQIVS